MDRVMKKHIVEELRIIESVLNAGNLLDGSAEWYRAKITSVNILIDALVDELTPDARKETEDDF